MASGCWSLLHTSSPAPHQQSTLCSIYTSASLLFSARLSFNLTRELQRLATRPPHLCVQSRASLTLLDLHHSTLPQLHRYLQPYQPSRFTRFTIPPVIPASSTISVPVTLTPTPIPSLNPQLTLKPFLIDFSSPVCVCSSVLLLFTVHRTATEQSGQEWTQRIQTPLRTPFQAKEPLIGRHDDMMHEVMETLQNLNGHISNITTQLAQLSIHSAASSAANPVNNPPALVIPSPFPHPARKLFVPPPELCWGFGFMWPYLASVFFSF
ncbi:transmembrane protein 231 isoform X4 [Plectropomus leopardus]|uniref:transmembrane protein 231 isoform X4 n=1 Tax=Plectropomus leopardus TaxID=160734 RepID=UPI001C4AD439|nr:transmembrane protein 231 isoform X4 [Plectropomus leopardus]